MKDQKTTLNTEVQLIECTRLINTAGSSSQHTTPYFRLNNYSNINLIIISTLPLKLEHTYCMSQAWNR